MPENPQEPYDFETNPNEYGQSGFEHGWTHPSELPGSPKSSGSARSSAKWAALGATAAGTLLITLTLLALNGPNASQKVVTSTLAQFSSPAAASDLDRDYGVVAVEVTNESGVVVGAGISLGDHKIITNASLVAGAKKINCSQQNSSVDLQVIASVLGVDLMADLAVLNTPEFDFPPVQLGSASEIDIGDRVTAMSIGSDRIAALSYGQIQERNALAVANDGSVLPGMLYTDLLSSGPLLDSSGAVVGFLTNSAPGNAIPIDDVRVIVAQIDTSGRPRHGWIGVQVRNDIGREGAIVVAVVAGAPSDQSGIQVGDRIISLGNDRVRSSADLLAAIAQRRAGDPVLVGLTRAGMTQKLPVSLGERPASSAQSGLRG